jgi:hypothetical protein
MRKMKVSPTNVEANISLPVAEPPLIRKSCPLAVKAKDSGSVRSAQGDEEASVLGYSMAISDGVISCCGAGHDCKSDVID